MRLKLKLNLASTKKLSDEIKDLKRELTQEDQIFQIVAARLVTTIHHLWQERNTQIFDSNRVTKIQRLKLIQTEVS